MESAILSAAIIAVVKAVRDAMAKEYQTSVIIIIAGLLGGLAVYSGLPGIPHVGFIGGFIIGIAGSGAYTVATAVGKNS